MKFCMCEIPSYQKNVVVDFDYFLKEKDTMWTIFIFKDNIAISSLDNLH